MLVRRNNNTNYGSALVIDFLPFQYNSQIKLSQEEILDISQEISRSFPLSLSTTNPELVIMPVDPYHLYVYWNLGKNLNFYWNVGKKDLAIEDKGDLENHLTLRIYSQPSDIRDTSKTKIWFDVPIHSSLTQLQVRLPSYETAYSAAIGKRYPDNRFVVFAHSNIIHLPVGKMAPYQPRDETKIPVLTVQTALPGIQPPPNDPVQHNIDKKAITGAKNKTTMRAKYFNESFNPEVNKGIEVSLHSEKEFSAQSHSKMSAAKHYDEAIINYLVHTTFTENDIAIAPMPKIKSSEATHFARKNASGQGDN